MGFAASASRGLSRAASAGGALLCTVCASWVAPSAAADVPGDALCEAAVARGYRHAADQRIVSVLPVVRAKRFGAHNAEGLEAVVLALQSRGVHVVLAGWPGASVALVDQIEQLPTDHWEASAAKDEYQRYVWNAGRYTEVLDLMDAFEGEGELFLLRDHHLSREGIDRMLEMVRDAVFEEVDPTELPRAEFEVIEGEEDTIGSLATAVSSLCAVEVPLEKRVKLSVERLDPPSLLEEVPSPAVVLVGSSLSNSRFRTAERLGALLHTPVLGVAVDGGGVLAGLYAYVHSPSFEEALPQVLVWEFPYDAFGSGAQNKVPTLVDERAVSSTLAAIDGVCDADPFPWAERTGDAFVSRTMSAVGPGSFLRIGGDVPSGLQLSQRTGGHEAPLVLPLYSSIPRPSRFNLVLEPTSGEVEILLKAPDGGALLEVQSCHSEALAAWQAAYVR